MRLVGILGGAFDPIHFGHLRMAEELGEALEMVEVRFIPTASPPHRPQLSATAEQRVAMLHLALAGNSKFHLDDREIRRYLEHGTPSYTIDTLLSLHEESDGQTAFCLILGSDAFLGLSGWHRWDELLNHCHIVVAHRPNAGLTFDALPTSMQGVWNACHTASINDLKNKPNGHILVRPITALDISATRIREDLKSGKSVRYLLPDTVIDYIKTQQLYIRA